MNLVLVHPFLVRDKDIRYLQRIKFSKEKFVPLKIYKKYLLISSIKKIRKNYMLTFLGYSTFRDIVRSIEYSEINNNYVPLYKYEFSNYEKFYEDRKECFYKTTGNYISFNLLRTCNSNSLFYIFEAHNFVVYCFYKYIRNFTNKNEKLIEELNICKNLENIYLKYSPNRFNSVSEVNNIITNTIANMLKIN